jgi:hypothetical protein
VGRERWQLGLGLLGGTGATEQQGADSQWAAQIGLLFRAVPALGNRAARA